MMTLDGTNTWVLREPGASASVVVDPGPIEDGHLDRLTAELGDVGLVLLTHHHFDHAEVAAEFARAQGLRRTRARPGVLPRRRPARRRRGHRRRRAVGAGAHDARPHRGLDLAGAARRRRAADRRHGARAAARRSWRTPTASSARTSTRSSGCARWSLAGEVRTLWPAHGPVLDDALGVLDFYLAHRRERLAQVERGAARARRTAHAGAGRGRGAAAPGGRGRLRRRRRVALGRRRAVRPRPAAPTSPTVESGLLTVESGVVTVESGPSGPRSAAFRPQARCVQRRPQPYGAVLRRTGSGITVMACSRTWPDDPFTRADARRRWASRRDLRRRGRGAARSARCVRGVFVACRRRRTPIELRARAVARRSRRRTTS